MKELRSTQGFLSTFTMVALLMAGCGSPPESMPPPQPAESAPATPTNPETVHVEPVPFPGPFNPANVSEEDVEAVVDGNNQFALELYQHLAKKRGNLFFSPSSISMAFAMTYAGAEGETAAEMRRTLQFDVDSPALHGAFGVLLREMNDPEADQYTLCVANRLWGEQTFPFRQDYIDFTDSYYESELALVDFVHNSEVARQTINEWVLHETQGKITNLLSPGDVNRYTALVLTNAIYFLGQWQTQFDANRTQMEPFYVDAQNTVNVPLMAETVDARYMEDETLQALELPYTGNRMSMVILLPRAQDGLPALEERLKFMRLRRWMRALRSQEVVAIIPRFKIEASFDLPETLKAMGMRKAFEPLEADFRGMFDPTQTTGPLFISQAVHKAYVDVNETGTEAAAATAVVMMASIHREPPIFRADHPFIFMIRDIENGSILFIGRVANPAL